VRGKCPRQPKYLEPGWRRSKRGNKTNSQNRTFFRKGKTLLDKGILELV